MCSLKKKKIKKIFKNYILSVSICVDCCIGKKVGECWKWSLACVSTKSGVVLFIFFLAQLYFHAVTEK